jgi:hypothetical protein
VLTVVVVALTVVLQSSDDDETPEGLATVQDVDDFFTDTTAGGIIEDTTPDVAVETPAAPAGAQTFTDEDGEYSLAVNPGWQQSEFSGLPIWYTGDGSSDFADNVNVVSENYDGDLDDYLDLSVENAPKLIEDFELVSSDVETGAFGQELGVMVFNGVAGGADIPLTFYATVAVGNGNAVSATFTAPRAQFETDVQDVIPYMATLQPE